MTAVLDLNADVGESTGAVTVGDDAAVIPLVTSVNVACGGHAGDDAVMRRTLRLARAHGVAAGAHPSYPDREGFGRRELGLQPGAIHDEVVAQVRRLAQLAGEEGVPLRHVKPHGALYNRAAREPAVADAVARAVAAVDPSLMLVGLAGSALVEAARAHGLRPLREGFCDRRYGADGFLVPRSVPGACLDDPAAAAEQALALATGGSVDTLCVHGDGPAAVPILRAVRARLDAAGIPLRAP